MSDHSAATIFLGFVAGLSLANWVLVIILAYRVKKLERNQGKRP